MTGLFNYWTHSSYSCLHACLRSSQSTIHCGMRRVKWSYRHWMASVKETVFFHDVIPRKSINRLSNTHKYMYSTNWSLWPIKLTIQKDINLGGEVKCDLGQGKEKVYSNSQIINKNNNLKRKYTLSLTNVRSIHIVKTSQIISIIKAI